MTDPYYCKLYIDTDWIIEDVQAVMYEACSHMRPIVAVDAPVYRNEDFTGWTGRPYDFIHASRYYAEVGTHEEIPEQIEDFQNWVCSLVASLRKQGMFVTVAGDFEDLIIETTGWNWTSDSTEPPGRH